MTKAKATPFLSPGARLSARTLTFFYGDGCHYCEQARPIVEQFQQARGTECAVAYRNLKYQQPLHGWLPNATPGYAIVINNELASTHVGLLTLKQLNALFDHALKHEDARTDTVTEDEEEDGEKKKRGAKEEEE